MLIYNSFHYNYQVCVFWAPRDTTENVIVSIYASNGAGGRGIIGGRALWGKRFFYEDGLTAFMPKAWKTTFSFVI